MKRVDEFRVQLSLWLHTKLYAFSMALVDPEWPPFVCRSSCGSCSIDSIRRRTDPPRMITSLLSGGVGARRSGSDALPVP